MALPLSKCYQVSTCSKEVGSPAFAFISVLTVLCVGSVYCVSCLEMINVYMLKIVELDVRVDQLIQVIH